MCVMCTEMLQDLLEVTEVDVVAIDLKDNLTRLKTCCSCLPACRVTVKDLRSNVTSVVLHLCNILRLKKNLNCYLLQNTSLSSNMICNSRLDLSLMSV